MRMRRQRLLLAAGLALAVITGCTKPDNTGTTGGTSGATSGSGGKQSLTIKGSDTMVQLAQAWAEAFMKKHPEISVSVTGGGSGTGIKALINKSCDIANSSRPMEEDEKQSAGGNVKEFVVAQDGLSVVVHPSNPVNELSLAQLKDIYTGKVTNWKQFGGPDQKIVVNSRESSSGTFKFFQEHVLNKEPFANTVMLQPATSQIVETVAQDKGGVGYVGLGYVTSSVKPLKIKKDPASPAVEATVENVLNQTYPLARPLYNYTVGDPNPAGKTWLDWVQGPEGQAIVKKLDFVPIR
jgi:phosphate transport system substrate-binding protein